MAYGSTLPIHLKGVYDVQIASSNSRPNYWKYIVGDVKTTTAIAEKMVIMSGLRTASRVGDGAGISFDEITTPYDQTFATELFAVGVEFTDKQLRTDQSGKLKRIGVEFGKSMNYQKEIMVADLINENGTGIDGVARFATNHPSSAGTWSNLGTAASLDATSLKAAILARKSHRALKGQPWLDLSPVYVITGDELEFTAEILIKSGKEAGVADNDMNPMPRIARFVPGNPFITSATSFTLVPVGDENPFFLLEGNITQPIREDFDIRTNKKLMTSTADHTTGSLWMAGVQHNAGL